MVYDYIYNPTNETRIVSFMFFWKVEERLYNVTEWDTNTGHTTHKFTKWRRERFVK